MVIQTMKMIFDFDNEYSRKAKKEMVPIRTILLNSSEVRNKNQHMVTIMA